MHIALIAATIAVFLTGCLQSATTILVNKDGSAQIIDTMLYSPQFINMMESMSNMGNSDAEKADAEPYVPYSDSSIAVDAADFGTGVTLDHWDEVQLGSNSGYVAYYKVKNISTLSINKDRGTAKIKDDKKDEAGETDVEAEPKPTVRLSINNGVLTIHNPIDISDSNEEVETDEVEVEVESDDDQRKALEMMAGFMQGLRFSVRVQTSSPIKETNATYADGSTITMISMDFDKIIEIWEEDIDAYKNFDRVKEKNIANFKALLAAYPTDAMMIEFEELITVKF